MAQPKRTILETGEFKRDAVTFTPFSPYVDAGSEQSVGSGVVSPSVQQPNRSHPDNPGNPYGITIPTIDPYGGNYKGGGTTTGFGTEMTKRMDLLPGLWGGKQRMEWFDNAPRHQGDTYHNLFAPSQMGGPRGKSRLSEEATMPRGYEPASYARAVASHFVIDNQDYRPDMQGMYDWGVLAEIYENTHVDTVAREVVRLEESGEPDKAHAVQSVYGYDEHEGGRLDEEPTPQGLFRSGRFLRAKAKVLTGQVEVGSPAYANYAANRLLDKGYKQLSQRYKGGSVRTGVGSSTGLLLDEAEGFKKFLGG